MISKIHKNPLLFFISIISIFVFSLFIIVSPTSAQECVYYSDDGIYCAHSIDRCENASRGYIVDGKCWVKTSINSVDCVSRNGTSWCKDVNTDYSHCTSEGGFFLSVCWKKKETTVINKTQQELDTNSTSQDNSGTTTPSINTDTSSPPEPYKEGQTETSIPKTDGNADANELIYAESVSFDGNANGPCPSFLGLIAWYCNVKISDEHPLEEGLSIIATNVLTDIIIIAAYLVIGYTIYGGYQYIFSAGDPNKVASSKKTLVHAFIGLAIVMSAQLIMSTIRFALLKSQPMSACATTDCIDPSTVIINAIQWTIGVGGTIALIFIVYGGIMYTTSAGDPNKLQKAKQIIIYALIGLAIVALAEAITAFISNMIREANTVANRASETTSLTVNNKSLSKELYEEKTT